MLSIGYRSAALKALVLLVATASGVFAQGPTLTLEEAVTLARRNNPEFLQQQNDVTVAEWGVRGAYGALLPGASASTSYSYTAAGSQRIGNFTGEELGLATSTDYYASSYNLGLNYRVSGSSLLAPGQAKSQRNATVAGVEATEWTLRTSVTRQYIAVKRAMDGVVLARQELARADENLRLAQARVSVGAAIPLEAKQAEVERGRTEVALLQAENLVQTERLRLMQIIATELPRDVQLTTEFQVRPVTWTEEELTTLALAGHPQLTAARAAHAATEAGVRMARSAYLPSLNMSAGFSGFMRQAGNSSYLVDQARLSAESNAQSCHLLNRISSGLSTPLPDTPADCSRFALSTDDERRIRDRNSVFPFGYSRDPLSVSMTVSLPIFDGFARERQVEQAKVARADAELRVRGERLRIRTEVGTALNNAQTAQRSAQLEARNAELAAEQLTAARERYRVGQTSFIELQEAETLKARADRALLTALYQFHENLAALEAAVGRSLSGSEIR